MPVRLADQRQLCGGYIQQDKVVPGLLRLKAHYGLLQHLIVALRIAVPRGQITFGLQSTTQSGNSRIVVTGAQRVPFGDGIPGALCLNFPLSGQCLPDQIVDRRLRQPIVHFIQQ